MRETQVQSLGCEDPLQKGMATHSSILAWKVLWTEEPGHRVEFGEVSGHRVLTKRDREIGVLRNVEAPTRPRLECRRGH